MAHVNGNFLKLASGYLFPEIARRTRAWQERNPGFCVLRLGIGNTTEALTRHIADAMHHKIDLLSNRDTYTGYGDEQGDAVLREALAGFYQREYGVKLKVTDFFISDGAKSDAANIQEIFSPSSVVAITDPSYPVYVDSNVVGGRSRSYNGVNYDGFVYLEGRRESGFIPSPPDVHVDLIYLCSPNNPTGAVATKDDLKAFVDYALRENAVIIFDAAYSDYIREPGLPHTIYEIEGAEYCAIEINSFSKNAGFTGVRLGWSIVPETLRSEDDEPGLIHRLWNRRQTTFFNGASNIAQAGGLAALSAEGRAECRFLVDYYLGNAKVIKEGLEEIGITCYGGVNSPYIWAECPFGMKSWDFFDLLLEKAHVVVTPGSGFGPAGEGYVRLSSYGHREDITKAVDAIKEALG